MSDGYDLAKAVDTRHTAYARHVAALAAKLKQAEPEDSSDGIVILLAESKVDGSALGTMRIHANHAAPLPIEQSIQLPDQFRSLRLVEATRLGVASGKQGLMVKMALFKAFYLYCKTSDVDAMVIAGRSPLDRMYQRLMFEDVYPGLGFIELAHANNLPHRIQSLNLHTVEARWAQANHPMFDFFIRTHHPDVELGETRAVQRNAHRAIKNPHQNRNTERHGQQTADHVH